MKIKKYTKKKNSMYSVLLEDGTILIIHEDLILKYGLLLKKELDQKTITKLEEENLVYISNDLAIKYLSKNPRSRLEIIEYLKRKEIDNSIISKTIEMLDKNNYLDDGLYAESFINDKILLTSDGPYKIIKDLISKGIEEKIIYSKVETFDEETQKEKINKLINRQLKSNRNKSAFILKNKIVNYIYNLGYDKELISKELSNYSFEDNKELMKKEYDKIYKKLSRKYSGSELEYKVKQKMYQLGFNNYE